MRQIEIYSTPQCPYCVRAKELLTSKGLEYVEIDVTTNRKHLQEMIERSGQHTVPQVFIDGNAIGGYDQLSILNSYGKLD